MKSRIAQWGLFTAKFIPENEVIIEYINIFFMILFEINFYYIDIQEKLLV